MEITGRLLKTSEVAQALGVETATVTRYIRDGLLKAIATSGGHYRVYETDLQAFLQSWGRGNAEGPVVLAVLNQKGGVGKTTVTSNIAVLLAELGMRVLAVDGDSQGHLTWSLGYNPDALEYTIYSAMLEDEASFDPSRLILHTSYGVDLAGNNILSSDAEDVLRSRPTWGTRLAKVLARIRAHGLEYDYVLIDSAPALGTLTINCLMATQYVLIPTQYEVLSTKGLQLLLRRIVEVREENRHLQVAGVVGTMVQPINASRSVDHSLRKSLAERGVHVFETTIRRSALHADVANRREILVASQPRSEHATSYRRLLAELLPIIGGKGGDRLSSLADQASVETPHRAAESTIA